MVRHPPCMILSKQLGQTEDGWRDALCTPVLLGLLQGRLPRRLCPGRRARRQKLHCSLLVSNPSGSVVSGWTKNTQTPDFFEKRKKSSKTQKLKNVYRYVKISDTPFDQRSLIHREAWFLGGPRIPKNPIFLKNGKNQPKRKN